MKDEEKEIKNSKNLNILSDENEILDMEIKKPPINLDSIGFGSFDIPL